jgi:signal transduction histidine kinase
LVAQFERDRQVPCRLTVAGTPRELGSEARLALYRVAQEALTNITKHARPDRVEVRLAYEPSATRLAVEDVGAPPAPAGDGGYGLTGMRERAELLGGTLTAGPTTSGFRVELELPA